MIVLEEVIFLPVYGVAVAAGAPSDVAMLIGLVSGDLLNSAQGWARLLRRGFLAGAGRPSLACARTIARYGIRAQVGSIVLLLNARLDFALVGALAGPGPLGIYAVASRYAELLRLPALALNYVLYPAYARRQAAAESDARAALRRTAWLPAAGAVPLAVLAPVVLPVFYGPAFREAVVPALILLVGMAGGGVTGVVTAYLSASGRPGMTSAALGAGLVVTLLLDVLLIPPYGVVGAAVASTTAYLSTAVVLMALFRAVTRSGPRPRTSTRTVASIAEVP
jgi:O-antigen/teichoic acid export membrane protein